MTLQRRISQHSAPASCQLFPTQDYTLLKLCPHLIGKTTLLTDRAKKTENIR